MHDAVDEPPADDLDVIIVMMTAPDPESAATIARSLVEERLAACCNIVPGLRSIYRWEGAIEDATETLVIIKTVRSGFEALRSRIVALHPYDVPEVLAIPLYSGDAAYLKWLRSSVETGSRNKA